MYLSEFPLYSEVKEEYLSLRRNGICRSEAMIQMQADYCNELADKTDYDYYLFWLAMADAQYYYKELMLEVAQYGSNLIATLNKETEIHLAPAEIKKRLAHYKEAPMPEKKVKVKKKFVCQWAIGDVFAFYLDGVEAEKCGLQGKYALLQKVCEDNKREGVFPLVTIRIWNKSALPVRAEEIQDIPILRINGRRMLYGDGYEYRIELYFTSQRQQKQLPFQYLGNYPVSDFPTDEYYCFREGISIPPFILPDCYAEDICFHYQYSLSSQKNVQNP